MIFTDIIFEWFPNVLYDGSIVPGNYDLYFLILFDGYISSGMILYILSSIILLIKYFVLYHKSYFSSLYLLDSLIS